MPHLQISSSVIYLVVATAIIIKPVNGIVFRSDSVENGALLTRSNSQEMDGGRSAEIQDSNSVVIPYLDDREFNQDGFLIDPNFATDPHYEDKQSKEEKLKWSGWNYLDNSKPYTNHEKTISLQVLDDDGRYAHARPTWPHDEYNNFPQYPVSNNFNFRKNSSDTSSGQSVTSESNKNYEWNRLHQQASNDQMFIGPGFYDYGSSANYAYPEFNHQSITDSSVTVATGSNGDGQIPNSASESANQGKLYSGGGGYNGGLNPHDYYRRKRLRLKIHPGLLAAPIAGFAAYKAVSAIAKKPLLFELGWIGNNKPEISIGGGGFGGGGFGWPQQFPQFPQRPPYYPYPYPPRPVLPYPNPYPINPYPYPPNGPSFAEASAGAGPQYPILRPKKTNSQKSAWWNPFAALSPRFRNRNDKHDEEEAQASHRSY